MCDIHQDDGTGKVWKNSVLEIKIALRLPLLHLSFSRATKTQTKENHPPTRSLFTIRYVCASWQNALDRLGDAMIDHTDGLFGRFRQP